MTIATHEEAKSLTLSSVLFVDEKIQEALYEALSLGEINRERFQELTGKLTQWQGLSRELISVI